MLKYALFFFIAAVAFCGYKVYAGHGSSAKSASYSGSKGYSIREATFLGTYDNRILCTVEFGNLETGEMSVLGMCEVIRGHRARIKSPAGGLIYVVATKELLPVTTAANQ